MKTRSILISLTLLLISSFSTFGQNSKFTGEWKLNTTKTTLSNNQLYLSKVTVDMNDNTLLTTRTYTDGNGGEYPFEENLTLDGKENKKIIYEMPRTTKATKAEDGSLAIESVTTFYNNGSETTLTTKENWQVDNEGKMLTIDFKNSMAGNEFPGTIYYDRVK